MTAEREIAAARRILVALDASPESLAALDHAASLAARLQAELEGLFVEDEDLLNLARQPFAREVSRLTNIARSLNQATLEEDLRNQAALARRALRQKAEALRLRWSFRVVRGRLEGVIQSASASADLVAMGRRRQTIGGEALGRTSASMARRLTCSVLMALPQQERPDAPVATVYLDSPCGSAALDLAVRTAREEHRPLLIIVPAKDRAEYETRRQAIEKGLHAEAKAIRVRPAIGPDGHTLKRALQQEQLQLLVLGCDLAGQLPQELAEFAAIANCPVLVMRGSL
jgi:nucleotide-binding universal stress UspA family protein